MKTKKGMALFLAILMIATNLVTIGTVANDTSSLSDNSEYQTLGTQISPITAAETDVSAADVTRMRTWINNNLINAGSNGTAPAYEISYNGTLLSESLSSWTFSNVRNTDVSENVESYTVTAANTSAGLTLRWRNPVLYRLCGLRMGSLRKQFQRERRKRGDGFLRHEIGNRHAQRDGEPRCDRPL